MSFNFNSDSNSLNAFVKLWNIKKKTFLQNKHKNHSRLIENTNTSKISSYFIQINTGYPVVNDPLYNHEVFGPSKGRGGDIGGKTDDQLVRDLINIHNAENWLGIDGDSELSLFKPMKADSDDSLGVLVSKGELNSLEIENFSHKFANRIMGYDFVHQVQC